MTDRLEALADRLAERVSEQVLRDIGEMMAERDAAPAPLLDAAQAARFLGIDRASVYAMAKDGRLPVVKLGDSERPRLRFDPKALADVAGESSSAPAPNGNGRPRRRRGPPDSDSELLPIRGEQ